MQVSTIPMESLAEILSLQLESGGRARLVVTGDSMYPTLRHRKDVVYLNPVSRKLERGDLILYKRKSGQYVLHRIVSKPKNGAFICCGDNQWEKEPMTEQQVVAIADGYIRNGKECRENTFRVNLWIFLFPVRRPLLAMRRFFGKLRRKLS